LPRRRRLLPSPTSLAAVEAGAVHVQGTINGFGERCGNANLCSIIPNLQLKMGRHCLSERQLQHLAEAARFLYEVANLEPDRHQAYVGTSAFAHKGGLHVSAIKRQLDLRAHRSVARRQPPARARRPVGTQQPRLQGAQFGMDLSTAPTSSRRCSPR
jgi:hypothetical protein